MSSGCPATRNSKRAVCLCKSAALNLPKGKSADIEFGCWGAVNCAANVEKSTYITCGSANLFSQSAKACQAAATVTCGTDWGL
jgi:hypothetical protein